MTIGPGFQDCEPGVGSHVRGVLAGGLCAVSNVYNDGRGAFRKILSLIPASTATLLARCGSAVML